MFRKQGTYNVNSTSSAERPPRGKMRCTVHLLDDRQLEPILPKKAIGADLLDQVFEAVDLKETDYFGLQFTGCDNQWEWLDPLKKIKKQTRSTENIIFYFRVKFYMADPSTLQEELTRYLFFLQVKQDILKGRLPTSFSTSAILSAYIVQAELGDYDPSINNEGYISEFRFVPNQTEDLEGQVEMHHKTLVGMTPADCEFHFLERAQRLELYGVDLHFARDSENEEMTVGVAHSGLLILQNKTKINQFQWAMMRKLGFKRKRFLVYLRAEEENHQPSVIGFDLPTYRAAKRLWKTCVQHHTFFRQIRPPNPPKYAGLLHFGSKFRYSGRTLNQTIEHGRSSVRYNYGVKRTPSKRFQRRTVGGYANMRAMRDREQARRIQNRDQADGSTTPGQQAEDKEAQEADSTFVADLGSPPKVGTDTLLSDVLAATPRKPAQPQTAGQPTEVYDEDGYQSDIDALMKEFPEGSVSDDGLITIRLIPDPQGRFGFNVKGGADQHLPVKVSRVSPDTPASRARPRLHEGDEVIIINGRDVRDRTHEEVVMFIRATRDLDPSELVVVVKPAKPVPSRRMSEMNALKRMDELKRKSSLLLSPSARPEEYLKLSIEQLKESIDNEEALAQFDQLYRRKPTLTCHDAFETDNFCRNRYRDIAPYDVTRVHLQEGPDYINASHVKMQATNTDLEYIAAQGPLPHTVNDFWQMIWEQNCNNIVMVTKEVENDHPKCHRYWPLEGETCEFGDIHVKLLSEQSKDQVSIIREIAAIHTRTGEERTIKQYQYVDWPDHGEPDDAAHFTEFVLTINTVRRPGEPLLVHCSAGIGRTGMFIMMETALVMMKFNGPIYPLELLTHMRDQRPMVIQTGKQYMFICQAIVSAFEGRLYLPKADRITASKQGAYNITEGTVDNTALSPMSEGRVRNGSISSSSSDSSSSSSSSDSDHGLPPPPGEEDRMEIKLNPLAMEDD